MSESLIDLRPDHLQIVRGILKKIVPELDVWAFGSRAKWLAKPYSDLDLAIISDTPLSLALQAALTDDFAESDLPFRVDIVDWATTKENFRQIIEQDKVVLQKANPVGRVSPQGDTRSLAETNADVGLRCANPTYAAKWQATTLGSICGAQGGAIQTGPFGSQLHTSDYKESGVPVVMPTNIGDGGIVEDGIARIDQSDVDRLSQHKLRLGDIVFSRRGDVTKNALIRAHEVGWFCGTGCLKVRLGNECTATAKFISHCLRLPDIKAWLVRHAVGATMPNLNTGILSAVPINLPPLQTQHEIAGMLDALDDRIALLRETNATLEAIAQALFKSWFVDFDPVHAKQQGRAPEGMDEATAALFPDRFEESELGLVPMGWRWATLAEAYEVNPQRKLRKSELAPYLDMANVPTSGHCAESVVQREMGSGSKFTNGDTLLARITPCLENGKSAFVDFLPDAKIGWGSTEFVVLRPKAPLPEYHAYLLCRHETFRTFAVQSMSGTSGRQRIQKDVLGSYLLALSTEFVAQAFANIVTPIQQSIAANHVQAQTLATLRDTLLPRLISGQLRLPEDTVV